jgi:hypothetical protein
MKVINNSARLITINYDHESYPLMPAGKAVEIPDEAREKCKFLSLLIKDGSVTVTEDSKEDDVSGDEEIQSLRDEAEALGVDVDNRWGKKKLSEAIESAKSAAE